MECPSKKPSCSLLLIAFIIISVGCDRGLQLGPAEGTVTLDGQPMEGASVIFTHVEGGPAATGSTDAQGRFKLRSVNREGAKVGEHKVTITKKETLNLGPFGPTSPEGIKIIWHVPEKYSKAETSGLTATVPDEEIKFELTSK